MDQDHLLDRSLRSHRDPKSDATRDPGGAKSVEIDLPIVNINRVVGTITGADISRKHGAEGLPEDTVKVNLTGSAGQSLGAFCPKGMTFNVIGDTNDYLGKGLSGAKISSVPTCFTIRSP